MKQKYFLPVAAAFMAAYAFCLLGCSNQKNLAVFKGGAVTRGELKKQMRAYTPEHRAIIISDMEMQRREIRSLAENKIFMREAEKAGVFDKTNETFQAEIKQAKSRVKERIFSSSIFPKKISLTKNDLKNLENIYIVTLMHIPPPYYFPKETKAISKEDAQTIRRALMKGADFEETAAYYGVNSAGPIRLEYLEQNYDYQTMRNIAAMKTNEIALIPFSFGIFVARLDGIERKSPEALEDLQTNAALRERFLTLKTKLCYREYVVEKILTSKKITRYYERMKEMPEDDTLIFKYPGTAYYGADLKKAIAQFEVSQPEAAEQLRTNWELRCIFVENNVLRQGAIQKYFETLRIEGREDFKTTWEREKNSLARTMLHAMRRKAFEAEVVVTDEMAREEYEKTVGSRYYNTVNERQVRMSFEEAKEIIYADVRIEKAFAMIDEDRKAILERANVQFIEKNFLTESDKETPGEKPADEKKGPGFFERLFGGADRKRIEAARNAINGYSLEIAQAQTAGEGKTIANEERYRAIALEDQTMVEIFDKKPRASLAFDNFDFYCAKGDFARAEQWLTRLKDVQKFNAALLEKEFASSVKERRWMAIEAAGNIGDARLYDAIEKAFHETPLEGEEHETTRIYLIEAMGGIGDERAVPILEAVLYDNAALWGARVMAQKSLEAITGNPYDDVELFNR